MLLGRAKGNHHLPAHLKQMHTHRLRSTALSPSARHQFISQSPESGNQAPSPDLQAPQRGPTLPGEDLSENQAPTLGNPTPKLESSASHRKPNYPSPRVSLALWGAPRENLSSSEPNAALTCCQNPFCKCGAERSPLPPKPKSSFYRLCSTQPPRVDTPKTSLSPSPKPHISTSGEAKHWTPSSPSAFCPRRHPHTSQEPHPQGSPPISQGLNFPVNLKAHDRCSPHPHTASRCHVTRICPRFCATPEDHEAKVPSCLMHDRGCDHQARALWLDFEVRDHQQETACIRAAMIPGVLG